MPICLSHTPFSPEACDMFPQTIWVFGDNLKRRGTAGLACIRKCPNAVGLVTKTSPARYSEAYLCDDDLQQVMDNNEPALTLITKHLNEGKLVNWPGAGIGTGRAELHLRAPKIALYYKELFDELDSILPQIANNKNPQRL